MEALRTENMTVKFGKVIALHEIKLSITEGERRGIIGPNGAGKTTLFNAICGHLMPTSGKIKIFNKSVTKHSVHKRVALGLGRTFQRMNIFPELSVMDNIRLALFDKKIGLGGLKLVEPNIFIKGKELAQRYDLIAESSEIAKNLSYGKQRMLEILLAVALEPRILLLDEPMAGLSGLESEIITQTIKKLPRKITIVVIEHDLDVLFDLCETMTVLNYGCVIADGRKESIIQNKEVQEIYLSRAAQRNYARD